MPRTGGGAPRLGAGLLRPAKLTLLSRGDLGVSTRREPGVAADDAFGGGDGRDSLFRIRGDNVGSDRAVPASLKLASAVEGVSRSVLAAGSDCERSSACAGFNILRMPNGLFGAALGASVDCCDGAEDRGG